MASQLVGLWAETQLHPGTGQGDGVVDREVQRNVTTNLPEIAGSSWKGALKQHFRQTMGSADAQRIFGSDPGQPISNGKINVSGAALLALPVPVDTTGFGWITSPGALASIARMASPSGGLGAPAVPAEPAEGTAHGPSGGEPAIRAGVVQFNVKVDPLVDAWARWIADAVLPAGTTFDYWRTKIRKSLWILDDKSFGTMTQLFTQIDEQVALTEDKTVVDGALRSVEYLPHDTVMVTRLDGPGDEIGEVRLVVDEAASMVVGGDESTGKGVVWLRAIDTPPNPEPKATTDTEQDLDVRDAPAEVA